MRCTTSLLTHVTVQEVASTRAHKGSSQGTTATPGQSWVFPGMTEDAVLLVLQGREPVRPWSL